jgi:RNA polymerase sigma-70 factor (ECF subfamily)
MADPKVKSTLSPTNQATKEQSLNHEVNDFAEKLSKYQRLTDQELVRLVKAGTVDAFDELIRRHQIKIHDLCYKMLRNYDDASDMAQETFLKAYKKINKFKEKSKFSTWLYRIAVNNCLNFIKKRRPTEELYEEITSTGQDDPVQRYKSKEFRDKIKTAVARLPEVQRAVFTLRTLEDLSYKEVSDILKKPISTIKVNHHLAVKNLRNYLKGKV